MFDKKLIAEQILTRMKAALEVEQDKQLANHFGHTQTTVINWRNRGTIPIDQCIQLALEKGTSLDWLILGRGSELGAASDTEHFVNSAFARNNGIVEVPLIDIRDPEALEDPSRVLGFISFPQDWIESQGLQKKHLFVLTNIDDSMTDTLKSGDIVLVNSFQKPAAEPSDGVFLIRVGSKLRIRRLQTLTDGSLRVLTDNRLFADETIPADKIHQVEIIGHCHWRGGLI